VARSEIRGTQVKDDSITGDDIDESTLVLDKIRDLDGDTKVQVEEGSDEDKIRFDTAGAERMVISELGAVGIGITSPTNPLSVFANISNTYVTLIDNDAGSNAHGLKVTSDGSGIGTNIFDVESGTTMLFRVRGDGRVGIGKVTSLPAAMLTVSSSNADGDIAVAHKIQHIGDDDTFMSFDNDEINFHVGGRQMIKLSEDSTDKIVINNGGNDIDLQIKGSSEANLVRTDAANDRVGIKTSSPVCELDVNGTIKTKAFAVEVRDVNSTSSVQATDYVLRCIQGSAITITLPAKSTNVGRMLIVKDALGTAATNNIILDGDSGDTIDGSLTYTLFRNGEAVTLVCDGINGWMLCSRVTP